MDEPIERPNIDELVGRLEDAIVLLLDDKDRAKALTVAVAVEDELVAHLDSSVGEDALSGEIPSLEKIGRGIGARKIPRAKGPSEEQLRAAAKEQAEHVIWRCIRNLERLPEAEPFTPTIQRFISEMT